MVIYSLTWLDQFAWPRKETKRREEKGTTSAGVGPHDEMVRVTLNYFVIYVFLFWVKITRYFDAKAGAKRWFDIKCYTCCGTKRMPDIKDSNDCRELQII